MTFDRDRKGRGGNPFRVGIDAVEQARRFPPPGTPPPPLSSCHAKEPQRTSADAFDSAPADMQVAVSRWIWALMDLGDEGVGAMREGIAQGISDMREVEAADTLSDPALRAHLRYYEALDQVLALLEGDSDV